MFEYVWNRPCSHLRRMSRDLRIAPQSLRWHLLRLRDGGLIASRTVKGKTVYYVPWAIRAEDVPLFAALGNGRRGRIVELVGKRGRVTQTEVFRALGTYQQAVLPPLGDLTQLGLLRTWKEAGSRYYALGDAHARLVPTYAAAADARLEGLLAVFERDGVSPTLHSRSEEEAVVQISNGVERSALRFRLVPDVR